MPFFIFIGRLLFSLVGQAEMEAGAPSHLSFSPNAASVPKDDPLHYGKSDTGSFKFRLAVNPLKYAEQFVCILHVESGSVIPDRIDGFIIPVCRIHFDNCPPPAGGKFDRVGQQVSPHLLQQGRIAGRLSQRGNLEIDPVPHIGSG